MTTTAFKATTVLAALAAVFCVYSTMPAGRVLTEHERLTGWGRISTPTRTDCSTCTENGSSCNEFVMPGSNSTSPYYACTGEKGPGTEGADYSATVTVSEGCVDTKWNKVLTGSWALDSNYQGETGHCGSRLISCEVSGSTCKRTGE